MPSTRHLHIGVFLPTTVQLLDLSPIDLFGMLSPTYLAECQLPPPLIALGTPSTIHYISLSSTSHVDLTAGATLKITKSILDPEVQPGKLDVLLIPGPEPGAVFGDEVRNFVRGHAAWKGEGKEGRSTDVLSVCTGCFVLAQSGVLKGKKASGPRALIPKLAKEFPGTKWVDDKRWVKDGNVWSSGGITNGQEMVAAYLRENFPGPSTEAILAMADVGDKGIDYPNGKAKENAWWLWQIIKASFRAYVWK